MRDGFLGFIAHVGETEGLAFDFAVTAVDDEMMFFAQVAHEFRHVDSAIIFHAGESKRAKIFFGEKFETSPDAPSRGPAHWCERDEQNAQAKFR